MIAGGVVVRFVLNAGHNNMANAFIVVGCCIIATVVIGCRGVLKENRIMLNIVRLQLQPFDSYIRQGGYVFIRV